MATFKDSLTKWFFQNDSTAGATTSRIPLLDASGNPIGSNTITNVGNLLAQTTPLMAAVNGVFIMCHRKSNNAPALYRPNSWTARQNAGEIADGVVVVEGGHVLVIAPTEASETLYWGSASVAGGGTTTTDRVTAYNDWAGQTNTASQITHAEMSGTGYAPGFCANYSHGGLGAGKWWLPSLGEMMMIYANTTKINYALSLIDGATQLQASSYWTSTESSATQAWLLSHATAGISNFSKTSISSRVRPVSAFIQ